MMKLCIKTPTGVAIMTVVFPHEFTEREDITLEELNTFADNEVARWSAANPGKYISHREITDADIPTDRLKRHLWADITDLPCIDILPDPEPTREDKKKARQELVDVIKVTTSTGKEFDGDEISQTRMARAIIGMQATGQPTLTWVLADNTPTEATLVELTEAMCLAGAAQAAVWVIPE